MKLLIADDHNLFRDALVQYVERASPGSFVALAENFYEVREALVKSADFDLVLLDFRMPGMNGFGGLKFVRESFPATPVAIMSGVAEPEDVKIALDMGARGYFPKTMSGKLFLDAIQDILNGKFFIPFDDAEKRAYMPAYHNDPVENNQGRKSTQNTGKQAISIEKVHEVFSELGLTPRERQIVGFLTSGAANKDIALALDLQVVTVKLHVRSICRKLGVKNRTQAALKMRDYGLLPENTTINVNKN